MRKGSVATSVVVLGLLALGATACSSSQSASAKKMAFCTANDSIDKAGANVNSASGFLAVLKAHQSALSAMESNAPSGSVGQLTRTLVNAADTAIRTNNTNALQSINGGDIDTYCGVDGSGNPLPSYFAAGKGMTFCNGFLPIYQAVSNASNAADELNAFVSNKAQIAQLATKVSSLPSSIQSKASATVSMAQTVIAQNSVASLTQNGNGPAQDVALYCGQNQ